MKEKAELSAKKAFEYKKIVIIYCPSGYSAKDMLKRIANLLPKDANKVFESTSPVKVVITKIAQEINKNPEVRIILRHIYKGEPTKKSEAIPAHLEYLKRVKTDTFSLKSYPRQAKEIKDLIELISENHRLNIHLSYSTTKQNIYS